METEEKWNSDEINDFMKILDEISLEVSRLCNKWSVIRNARVLTISGKDARFDYVMRNLQNPNHIITVKAFDKSIDCIDTLLKFIIDSLDAVAWRYLIITKDPMNKNTLELCEDQGAIIYSMSELTKILKIVKMKNSLNTAEFQGLQSNLFRSSVSETSISSEINHALANIIKTGRKRRDRSEIIENIFYWLSQYDGMLITSLVYKTNLNHKILSPILEEMCRKNLIECNKGNDGRNYYKITEMGLKCLDGIQGPSSLSFHFP